MNAGIKALGITAIVFGIGSLVFAVVATLLAIWTGDDRWGQTAGTASIVGIVVVGCGIGLVQS